MQGEYHMSRVEIYDIKNRDRLLGTVDRPFDEPRGRYWSVALMKAASTTFYPDPEPRNYRVNHLTFEMDWRWTNTAWHRSGDLVFLTATGLDDLRYVKGFRFPGETPAEAAERRHWQR